MKIHVHIERLVLEGLPVDRHSAPLVQAAVEEELSQLMQDTGLPIGARSVGAIPLLRTPQINLVSTSSPEHIGNAIAQSLHGGFGQ